MCDRRADDENPKRRRVGGLIAGEPEDPLKAVAGEADAFDLPVLIEHVSLVITVLALKNAIRIPRKKVLDSEIRIEVGLGQCQRPAHTRWIRAEPPFESSQGNCGGYKNDAADDERV